VHLQYYHHYILYKQSYLVHYPHYIPSNKYIQLVLVLGPVSVLALEPELVPVLLQVLALVPV
jgi:hypothetical protein